MKGIERQYLRECINALCNARSALLSRSCEEAISKTSSYGKGDTLSLDAIPERKIIDTFEDFDPHLPIVTEEIGSSDKLRGAENEVIFFSDPMDRSKVLAEFLSKHDGNIEAIFQAQENINEWEINYGRNVELRDCNEIS